MQAELGARDIAVDQAGVGIVAGESRLGRGAHGEVEERRGHRGPRDFCVGIQGVVTIAGAVGYPTHASAVGHRDGHGVTTGHHQVAECGLLGDAR